MSFVSDFLFGEEGTPSTVQDITPDAFRNLQGMVGGQLGNILEQSGIDPNMPTTAGLTPQERQLLSGVQGMATQASPQLEAARGGLLRAIQGGNNPLLQGSTPAGGLMQDILSGRTMDPASNPMLQASIEAAQRPLREQFGDDLIATRSQFTRGGQFVQPQSSSPFDVADARLRTGLANAMGDVSTNLVAENLQQERARQMQALGLTDQAFQTGQNRQLEAARAAPAFDLAQLEGVMSAMEAQALPRLIEQRGMDRGLEEFNNQMQRFLSALQIGGSVSQPQNVTLPGSEGTSGVMGPLLTAAGTAIGGPVGGAVGQRVGNMFNRNQGTPSGGTVNTASLDDASAWGPVFR
ncbi:MAG: hypothetical protein ACOC9Q_01800 [bacterium]